MFGASPDREFTDAELADQWNRILAEAHSAEQGLSLFVQPSVNASHGLPEKPVEMKFSEAFLALSERSS